jgi:Flp pilus assembly protein CpaB
VSDADVRVARVHADGGVLGTLFGADDVAGVRGHVVTDNVRAGELLARGSVRAVDAGAAARVMSFPLPSARAVGGKLASGDRVDVVAVEHDSWRAGYVLTDASVVAVDGHDSGPLGGSSDDITVSLVVDPDGAARLAAALEAGTVTLVRATGAPRVTNPAPFVPSAKAGGAGA